LHRGRTTRSVIRFLVAEGVKGSEIHDRMLKAYGNNCLNRSKRVEQFKSGRVSVCDEQQGRRPVEVATFSLESSIYA